MIKLELGRYDKAYAKGLIEGENHEDIVRALAFYLRAKEAQAYSDICSIIRDLVLGPFESDKNEKFNALIDGSSVIRILEKNILSGNYFQRSSSIYTLGKICSKTSLRAMKQAVIPLALKDPINGSDLVSEIWWLEGKQKSWKLLDQVGVLGFYQRWGALHVLTHWDGSGEFGKIKTKYLKRFASDDNPLIRIEAEYELEENKKRANRKIEWEPVLRFDSLRTKMGNILFSKERPEYGVKDLNRLVDAQLKNPK